MRGILSYNCEYNCTTTTPQHARSTLDLEAYELTMESAQASSSGAGCLLQNLPSRNPMAFAKLLGGADQTKMDRTKPSQQPAAIYFATHDRTQPPSDQVIRTEKTNILLRSFYQLAEAKRERLKRSAEDTAPPPREEQRASKLPRHDAASAASLESVPSPNS
jgi:DET1- and DDB1-associated protein 1